MRIRQLDRRSITIPHLYRYSVWNENGVSFDTLPCSQIRWVRGDGDDRSDSGYLVATTNQCYYRFAKADFDASSRAILDELCRTTLPLKEEPKP